MWPYARMLPHVSLSHDASASIYYGLIPHLHLWCHRWRCFPIFILSALLLSVPLSHPHLDTVCWLYPPHMICWHPPLPCNDVLLALLFLVPMCHPHLGVHRLCPPHVICWLPLLPCNNVLPRPCTLLILVHCYFPRGLIWKLSLIRELTFRILCWVLGLIWRSFRYLLLYLSHFPLLAVVWQVLVMIFFFLLLVVLLARNDNSLILMSSTHLLLFLILHQYWSIYQLLRLHFVLFLWEEPILEPSLLGPYPFDCLVHLASNL